MARISKHLTSLYPMVAVAATGVALTYFSPAGPASQIDAGPAIVDTTSKAIMGVSLAGVATGLYEDGRLTDEAHMRAERMTTEIPRLTRDLLSDLEMSGYNQALQGQWSQDSLEAYLDIMELPGEDIEMFQAVMAGAENERDGLVAFDAEVHYRHPDILKDVLRWRALTELTTIGANYDYAMAPSEMAPHGQAP